MATLRNKGMKLTKENLSKGAMIQKHPSGYTRKTIVRAEIVDGMVESRWFVEDNGKIVFNPLADVDQYHSIESFLSDHELSNEGWEYGIE